MLAIHSLILCAPTGLLLGWSATVKQSTFWVVVVACNLICLVDFSANRFDLSSLDRRPQAWADRLFCYGFAGSLLGFCWLAVLASHDTAFTPLTAWGAVFVLLGCGLRKLAMRQIGCDFVSDTDPRHRHLQQFGIYAVMRHPGEMGLLMAVLGVGLISNSLVVLAIWFAWLLPLSYHRCLREERRLMQRFGSRFVDYRRRTLGLPLIRLQVR